MQQEQNPVTEISTRSTHPWVAEGTNRVRFGLFGRQSLDWSQTLDWAQTAEELGFDSFWMADHPLTHGREVWTYLAGLAAGTRRIRLGSLVSCVYYRHPALLAQIVASVDHISNGRAVLGLGMGDLDWEFAQLGLHMPPVPERQAALAEGIEIIQRLWAGEEVETSGRHFRTQKAALKSGPVQAGGIPVLVAGGGEKVTLRQVAQYADACNFGPGNATGGAWTVEDVRRKYSALDRHCMDLGRPTASVLRTYYAPLGKLGSDAPSHEQRWVSASGLAFNLFHGNTDHAIGHYRSIIEAGARYFVFVVEDQATLQLLAEKVMPNLAS